MYVKFFTGLAIAVLLTACGGSSDHIQGPLGTWSAECINSNIKTYIFDRDVTLTIRSYSDENCTENLIDMTYKFNALYDPELKTTSSGVEALKASLTLASDIMITLNNSDLIEVYEMFCPHQSWAVNQAISIMACESALIAPIIAPFETALPMLLYVDGNNLYTSNIFEPSGDDGFPNDVNYENPHMMQ